MPITDSNKRLGPVGEIHSGSDLLLRGGTPRGKIDLWWMGAPCHIPIATGSSTSLATTKDRP